MKSLGFKLWSSMMLLVFVVLILLWLFQIVFLKSFYLNMKISEIKEEGQSIVQLFATGDKSNFEDKAEIFAANNNLSLELVDIEGNFLYTSGSNSLNGEMPMMRNNARVEAYDQAVKGKIVTIPMTHPRFGNKFMLIGIPYQVAKKVSGVFLINMPVAPVEDTVSILKKQLIYITLILIVVAVIIALILAKTLTRPILEIKKVSENFAAGDFTKRIKNKRKDEIGSLSETINHMGQELSKIDQLRKDLIANVSHELRTPLSLIRGYAETIKDVSGDNPEKREKQLKIIIEESERLGKIVNDILDLSQLQSGYIKLNQKPFSINEMIKNIVKRYDILINKTGIPIELVGLSDIKVFADEAKIEQVLLNLVNNAFNHTKKGDNIMIRLLDDLDKVKIEVADTGVGIPKDELKYVWNKYYKVEKTGERKMIGTGLGLAIVKEILDAHGVKYNVTSVINKGTTFWFELKK